MTISIPHHQLVWAAQQGNEAFLNTFHQAILDAIGGTLDATTMPLLNGEQITLLAYMMFRKEVLEGGFVQLIQNGLGDFIFMNPFAKAMRLWGAKEFSKLIYEGRKLYEQYGSDIARERTDDEFMALYEQYPEFDELDDEYVDREEEITDQVAHYVDEHIHLFAEIAK